MGKSYFKSVVMIISLFFFTIALSGCSNHEKNSLNSSETTNSQQIQTIKNSLDDKYKKLASTIKINEIKTTDKNQWVLYTLGKPIQYEGLAYIHNTDTGWKVEHKNIVKWNENKPFFSFVIRGNTTGNTSKSYVVVGGHTNDSHISSLEIDSKTSSYMVIVNQKSPYYLIVLNEPSNDIHITGLDKSDNTVDKQVIKPSN